MHLMPLIPLMAVAFLHNQASEDLPGLSIYHQNRDAIPALELPGVAACVGAEQVVAVAVADVLSLQLLVVKDSADGGNENVHPHTLADNHSEHAP